MEKEKRYLSLKIQTTKIGIFLKIERKDLITNCFLIYLIDLELDTAIDQRRKGTQVIQSQSIFTATIICMQRVINYETNEIVLSLRIH